jgi:peptide/nickel transport system ATP-binding protein
MPSEPLLSIRGLGKTFGQFRALDNVTLTLARGRTLGVVGLSGSGKSTLARCLALFEAPSDGEVWFQGRNLSALNRKERLEVRAAIQLIFQDPAASLNPRFTAGEIIAEPLVIQRRGDSRVRQQRPAELMEMVGLPSQAIGKPALDLSGGERQRLAIARALALEPKLLILDESFSGLDLTIQAQIANLLTDLKKRLGFTYILITHDLSLAAQLSDEIAVMDRGRLVEHAATAEILARPQHPRTRELLDACLALSLGGSAP